MKEKRRLNRVQWVTNSSAESATPAESSPAPWATPPAENDAPFWAPSSVEDNSTSATTSSVADNAASWAVQPSEEMVEESYAEGEEAFDEAGFPLEYDLQGEEVYEEAFYDEEEEALLEQQRLLEEAERRTLRDALLILVALYIICGVAPLFMGLFVPLRIFFWLEIGGWAIILAWLLIGVRRPLMRWFRERARKREEQVNEQVAG